MSTKTEGDPPITSLSDEELIVKMPKEPSRMIFETDEIMIGSDKLCMLGEWEVDLEKINTLEFIMGDKKEKRYVYKKV